MEAQQTLISAKCSRRKGSFLRSHPMWVWRFPTPTYRTEWTLSHKLTPFLARCAPRFSVTLIVFVYPQPEQGIVQASWRGVTVAPWVMEEYTQSTTRRFIFSEYHLLAASNRQCSFLAASYKNMHFKVVFSFLLPQVGTWTQKDLEFDELLLA